MCARFISSSGGIKLTSMLKSLQVGEFLVSGPVYVGDSDTPTTTPLVVHSNPPEDVVPASDALTIPMPSDTEPLLPPAQIDFLPPLDELDGCDDEDSTQNNEFEPVTEDVCPPLLSLPREHPTTPVSHNEMISEPPSKICPQLSKLSHLSLHRTSLVLVIIIIVLHGHKRNPLIAPVWNSILATQILAPLYEKTTNASSSLQISRHKNFTSIQTSIITMKR